MTIQNKKQLKVMMISYMEIVEKTNPFDGLLLKISSKSMDLF